MWKRDTCAKEQRKTDCKKRACDKRFKKLKRQPSENTFYNS